jgi:hypothetical protein
MMREFCFKHQLLRPPCEQCTRCAAEAAAAAGQVTRRDAVHILESRIADQDQVLGSLIRQINALRQIVLDLQRAQNARASS